LIVFNLISTQQNWDGKAAGAEASEQCYASCSVTCSERGFSCAGQTVFTSRNELAHVGIQIAWRLLQSWPQMCDYSQSADCPEWSVR